MSAAPGRPLVLVIIDGWGYRTDPFGNAIAAAKTPNWDALWQRWPHTILAAAGEPVGLPEGQQGNSEVGHLNIGAGRVVYQDLTRINRAIQDRSFTTNPVLRAAMQSSASGHALHLMGLVSPGGVHSSSQHLYALLEMAQALRAPRVFVHAFTDGRDEPPTSAAEVVERQFSSMEKEFVPAVEAMPAEKFDFAPTTGEFKGVRTFATQAKHVAAVNYMLGAALLGEKPPVELGGENGPDSLKTKDDIDTRLQPDDFASDHGTVRDSEAPKA